MNKYEETLQTWNKVADLYQEKFIDLDIYNQTYDLFCEAIKSSKANVLDIGCGSGNNSRYFLSKRPDFKIHGIDIAPNMVSLARNNNPTARFEIMNIRAIDELKSTYDGIICGFCVPCLSGSDVDRLFTDCKNLLNKNGLLYISFVKGQTSQSGYIKGINGDRSYFYYHPIELIQCQFSKNYFNVVKMFKIPLNKNQVRTEIDTILTVKKHKTFNKTIDSKRGCCTT